MNEAQYFLNLSVNTLIKRDDRLVQSQINCWLSKIIQNVSHKVMTILLGRTQVPHFEKYVT